MRRLVKIGSVFAGYALAIFVAWLVTSIYEMQTSSADAQASAGMYAFGDLILCVGVFCLVALAPTGLAIFFLVPWGKLRRSG